MKVGKWNVTIKDFVWFIICLLIVISFTVGLIIKNKTGAADVISGASTVVSIVLSVVAILYTMIEGANSSSISQGTIDRLTEIDKRLDLVANKIEEQKEIEKRINLVLPELIAQADKIQGNPGNGCVVSIDSNIAQQLELLRKYLHEDIED